MAQLFRDARQPELADRLSQFDHLRHVLRGRHDGDRLAARGADRPANSRGKHLSGDLAVSFVVTGTVWGWLLNPGIGVQKLMHDLGWTSFRFEWLIDRDMAIYTIVIAGVWQASGFAMALLLAGLRSVDADLLKAAQIDGAGPVRTYLHVVFPTIGPIVVAVLVMLLQFAIKTYDLV